MTKAKWKSCEPNCTCWRHKPAWNRQNNPSSNALHLRLKNYRGVARQHKCIDCDNQAYEWSQIHDTDGLDLHNHYVPRCRKCHMVYDKRFREGNPEVIAKISADAKVRVVGRSRDSFGKFI